MLQQGFGDERQIPSCARTGNVKFVARFRVDVPEAAGFPSLHIARVQHYTHILIAVHALGRSPVLGEAIVFLMFLVEQLDRPRIAVEGFHRRRVVFEANDTRPFVMCLYVDTDLLRDEVTDALAATPAAYETVGIYLHASSLELLLVGIVVGMKVGIDVAVAARVEGVLVEVANEARSHLSSVDLQ